MISEKLKQAREFEERSLRSVNDNRPRFHVTGGVGWINDPNGFSAYRDEYHLFYQYHPYDIQWGPMHWGHVKTKDFVTWERLPVALAPDTAYDKDGVFSGGALEMPDGRHLLMYTGVRDDRQTQCIAIGDGMNYEKYEGNPVITGDRVPDGGSTQDFRDPHIWRENGVYRCAVANRAADCSGTVLLYESPDAIHWKFVSKLASSHNRLGGMWECPDVFRLDGKDVVIVCPQEMEARGLEFHPGNAVAAMIGVIDGKNHQLHSDWIQAIDYGLDFYAPQTLETYDGRRVLIGWMQNWETAGAHPKNITYMGQMTFPRELRIKDGRLIQSPVREIEEYRTNPVAYGNVLVSGETTLPGVEGRFLDLSLVIRPEDRNCPYQQFQIHLAKDETHRSTITIDPARKILRFDRTQSGLACDIVNVREAAIDEIEGSVKLRILMDLNSVEIFVNDGRQALSNIIYTPVEAKEIVFSCEGRAMVDIEKYDIENT